MTRMLPSPHDEAFAQSNDVAWRRSRHSGTSGACVEVARVADGGLAVRDSKIRKAPASRSPLPPGSSSRACSGAERARRPAAALPGTPCP